MKRFLSKISSLLTKDISHQLKELNQEILSLKKELLAYNKTNNEIQINSYLNKYLYSNQKYLNNKRLNKYEYQSFSQYGEDGIIKEIFNRLAISKGYFVEFGVEIGLECNTTNLLLRGWSGLWIEGLTFYANSIKKTFNEEISNKKITLINEIVTINNIEDLLITANVPKEFDLLSIDIDYNDYYIWKAIKNFRPKVLVI